MKLLRQFFIAALLVVSVYAKHSNTARRPEHVAVLALTAPRTSLESILAIKHFREENVAHAQKIGPAFVQFVQKYGVSEDTSFVVLQHSLQEISDWGCNHRLTHGNFYCKKYSLDRALYAARLKECITRHNLDLLDVAHKEVAYINGEWIVFAHKVDIADNSQYRKISLPMLKQLIILVEETGYSDFHSNIGSQGTNWIFAKNGKLVCVDTELRSFGNANGTSSSYYSKYNASVYTKIKAFISEKNRYENKLNFVRALLSQKYAMTEEAYAYLLEYIQNLESINDSLDVRNPLTRNSQYDPAGVNIAQTVEELAAIEHN